MEGTKSPEKTEIDTDCSSPEKSEIDTDCSSPEMTEIDTDCASPEKTEIDSDCAIIEIESRTPLTEEQTLVYKIIQADDNDERGIEKDVLTRRVPKYILPNIDDIIDFLIKKCYIFTGVTEDHFRVCWN